MSNPAATIDGEPVKAGLGLIAIMAREQHMDPNAYALTVKATCFDKDCSREQFMAFLMIAQEHKLNPVTREIYAFEKQGKITPIVSIDGWLKIINSHPDFEGMEFTDNLDDEGKIVSITCKIYRQRNGRPSEHPTFVTEYLSECKRDTMPWKQWPIRMLRHKATIQAARYAFGFAGIYDADEGERIREAKTIEGSVVPEDVPETAAKRIASKIKARVEKEDLAPSNVSHEASPSEYTGYLAGEDPMDPDAIAAEFKADPETGEIKLDDIPDLKTGAQLSKEAREFVDDMEGGKK